MPTDTKTQTNEAESGIRKKFSTLDDEVMLNTAELSQVTQNSTHTFKQWRRLGVGPKFHRLGRSVRYRVGDIREWLAENTTVAA